MNFRDTLVTCSSCGKQFIFTVETQRKMAERGLEIEVPETCPDCEQRLRYGGLHHGRIKWFSVEKGYGFITTDGGSEIFVHRNSVSPTEAGTRPALEEGQEVLYDIEASPKGPQAVRVTLYHQPAE